MWLTMMMTAALAQEAAAPRPAVRACADAPIALPEGMPELTRRTVRIETALGSGSGVMISPDGFVLTAAHVVRGSTGPSVIREDGLTLVAEVLRVDVDSDLALLRTPARQTPCVPLASLRAAPGADVYVVGAPGGEALSHSVSKGIVSGWRAQDGLPVLQTDASLNAGNSGGGLFDAQGHLQGIVRSKHVGVGVEGLGFAVGVEAAASALRIRFLEGFSSASSAFDESGGVIGGVIGGVLLGKAATAGVTITNRPASPEPIDTKRACKKAGGRIETSPFGDSLEVHKGGHFKIRHGQDARPTYRVMFGYPPEVGAQVVGLQQGTHTTPIEVEFALEDGTTLATSSTKAQIVPGFFWPLVGVDLEMTDEGWLALASSPTNAIRWRFRDGSWFVSDKSKGDAKTFMRGAACIVGELGLLESAD